MLCYEERGKPSRGGVWLEGFGGARWPGVERTWRLPADQLPAWGMLLSTSAFARALRAELANAARRAKSAPVPYAAAWRTLLAARRFAPVESRQGDSTHPCGDEPGDSLAQAAGAHSGRGAGKSARVWTVAGRLPAGLCDRCGRGREGKHSRDWGRDGAPGSNEKGAARWEERPLWLGLTARPVSGQG